jgi:hypothetical protein
MFNRTLIVGALMLTSLAAFAEGTATPRIDKREANEEKRIDAGVASGALTTRETKTLDAREDKLAADEAAAKADGDVTRSERVKLRAEAQRDSRAIRRKKHNARTTEPKAS